MFGTGLLLIMYTAVPSDGITVLARDRIAILPLRGVITQNHRVIRELRDYRDDSSVRGFVLWVDSPGGEVAPSQTIYRELARVLDAKTVMQEIADTVRSHCGVEHVSVALVQDEGEQLNFVAWSGYEAGVRDEGLKVHGPGLIARVARERRAVYLPDVSTSWVYLCGDERVRSEYAVPLRSGGEVLGVLNCESFRVDGIGDAALADVRVAIPFSQSQPLFRRMAGVDVKAGQEEWVIHIEHERHAGPPQSVCLLGNVRKPQRRQIRPQPSHGTLAGSVTRVRVVEPHQAVAAARQSGRLRRRHGAAGEELVRDAGCDGYITKPISIKTFLDKIAEFLALVAEQVEKQET